jgi:hypothetical protein
MSSILNHHALIKTAKVGRKAAPKDRHPKVVPKEHHRKAGSAQIAAVAAKAVRK